MLKRSIFLLLISCTLIAQDNIEFKPMTWENLQEFQKDSLLSIKSLQLSQSCPKSLIELNKTYSPYPTTIKRILGSYFIWTEFYNEEKDICVVKHLNMDFEKPKTLEKDEDMLLNTLEAQVLLSAAIGYGFKNKNINTKLYVEQLLKISNQEGYISTKKLNTYGGEGAVLKYMEKEMSLKNEFYFNSEAYKSINKLTEGPIGMPAYSTQFLNYFEENYTASQKQYLIGQDLLKKETKRIKILSYSKRDLELLENQWILVSIKDINSGYINLLDNSNHRINFNKNAFKFYANLGCYNFSGSFNLDNEKLDLNFGPSNLLACLNLPPQQITTDSKAHDKDTSFRVRNPKEILYQQQTELIKDIINNVIEYEINDSELILFTQDPRKLFFKKVST